MTRSGARDAAIAAAGFLVLAIAWSAPASLAPTNTVPNLGDPLHLAWVLAWDAHQLVRRPWALFEANGFYPYAHSLTFGDHLLPEALLVAPVYWLTGNAVLASNVAVVLGLALSALSMFLLVRHLVGSFSAAALAGLAYAFNSFTLHELPRVHVLHLEWWPLSLLFLDRFVRDGRARDARLWAGTLVLQGLSGTYYLIYSILFAPLWVFGCYLAARRRPSGREVRGLGLALGLAALPAAFLLWPYLVQFRAMGFEKRINEPLLTLPEESLAPLRGMGFENSFAPGADLLSYLDPTEGSRPWGALQGFAPASELPHFVGFAGGLLIALGAVSTFGTRAGRARPLGLVAVATAVAALAFSLGPRVRVGGADWGPGPYALLYRLPLARGMASPERFGAVVILGSAILLGIGAAALLQRLAPRARLATTAVLALLIPLEHWRPPLPAAPVPAGADLPGVYSWLAQNAPEPLVELPLYPERLKRQWAAYLYFSTIHWRRIPIGRASFYPPAHDRLAWELRGFPDEMSIGLLQRLGIRTLVVHPRIWPAGLRDERLRALESDERLSLACRFDDRPSDRYAALQLGDERIYRLAPADAPLPRPCTPEDELARDGWTLRGSGVTSPDLARDGDPRTAWFTLDPQRQGDHLQVTLERPETVAAVVLETSYPYEEFPRGLDVLVPGPEGTWREVPYRDGLAERWVFLDELLRKPRDARLVLRIPPQTVSSLVLVLGERDRDWASPRWSVPELRLYRECH